MSDYPGLLSLGTACSQTQTTIRPLGIVRVTGQVLVLFSSGVNMVSLHASHCTGLSEFLGPSNRARFWIFSVPKGIILFRSVVFSPCSPGLKAADVGYESPGGNQPGDVGRKFHYLHNFCKQIILLRHNNHRLTD